MAVSAEQMVCSCACERGHTNTCSPCDEHNYMDMEGLPWKHDQYCVCHGTGKRFWWLWGKCSANWGRNKSHPKPGEYGPQGCVECNGTGYVLLRDPEGQTWLGGLMRAAFTINLVHRVTIVLAGEWGIEAKLEAKERVSVSVGYGETPSEAVADAILKTEGNDGYPVGG